MKLTIPRGVLDEIRKGMGKVISSRTTIALHQHIKIEAQANGLKALGTDGESALLFECDIDDTSAVPGMCLLPLKQLSAVPGGARDPVTITTDGDTKVTVAVTRKDTTDRIHFRVPPVGDFPADPFEDGLKFKAQAEGAAVLIGHALGCADSMANRYSLNCLALERDRIVATNGRKLYAANSFAFPWRSKQAKLVPASKAFRCKAIVEAGELSVAASASAVYFRFGDRWTLKLPVVDGHFPDWERVVPKKAKTSIEFTEEDAKLLMDRLPALPGADEDNAPIELAADGSVRLVAYDEHREHEALDLPDATVTGKKTHTSINRTYLLDGLKMGFRKFELVGPDRPIVARNDTMLFLFMPLGGVEDEHPDPERKEKEEMASDSKNQTPENGSVDMDAVLGMLAGVKDQAKQLSSAVAEAEKALKSCAGDMRKKERLVKSTLSSLKELKELAV